jgi:AP-4 complex subunit epsilon-1
MEYLHQRTLAPFILVNLFTLIQRMSPHMPGLGPEVKGILTQALQTYTTECSATSALLYESVRTCVALGLTDMPQLRAAVSMFMKSSDQNTKFVGLGLLQTLPELADEFQTTIIDCLEHPGATIRLRTLGLLHAMANEAWPEAAKPQN